MSQLYVSSSCWDRVWCCCFVSDGIRLRLYSRGAEVRDRLSDTLPSARGSGPQPSGGSEHQSGLLVHRRGLHPAGGQHQSGGSSQELLLRQENHYNTRGLLTPRTGAHRRVFIQRMSYLSWNTLSLFSVVLSSHPAEYFSAEIETGLFILWLCVESLHDVRMCRHCRPAWHTSAVYIRLLVSSSSSSSSLEISSSVQSS